MGYLMNKDRESLQDVYKVMLYVHQHTPATPRRVRTILTHAYPDLLTRHTCFSGYVSQRALEEALKNGYRPGIFEREHYLRFQSSLTKWVSEGFLEDGFEAFEQKVVELSKVHITLRSENRKLISKSSSYESLEISLIYWGDIPVDCRRVFHKVLKGKVVNIAEFSV